MRLLLALLTLLSLNTALARVSVLSAMSETFATAAGQTVTGKLLLGNDGEAPAQARLYRTDYLFQAGGEVSYGTPGSHPRSNSPWIELGAEIVTVPPKGELEVPYTIRVPAGATVPGSYWSLLMVEPLQESDPLAAKQVQQGLSIRQVVRYGVQVLTELGGGGKKSLSFVHPALGQQAPGQFGLQVDLHNDGERYLRPAVYAEVYDAAGALVGRVEGAQGRLYPGTSSRQQFALPSLPAGDYQVVVVADGGDSSVFGVRYALNVPKN